MYSARGDDGQKNLATQLALDGFEFPEAPLNTNTWRQIVTRVSPQGMTVTMANAAKPDEIFDTLNISDEKLKSNPPNLEKETLVVQNGGESAVPIWQPRCRFGVFASSSTVEIRNVRISPHP
jgi:hypothetical protein